MEKVLTLGNITCVPIIHGRCAFAQEVRSIFLKETYSCIAVELPPSLKNSVCEAVYDLPHISAVVYKESVDKYCYVPVEPGEGITEAIRLGLQEHLPLEFVDMEVETFRPYSPSLPDEYGLEHFGLELYYQSVQSYLLPPEKGSIQEQREIWMAEQLRKLSKQYSHILFVCGIAHWNGIKNSLLSESTSLETLAPIAYDCKIYSVHPDSIYLVTGEIPYITYLYEKKRYDFDMKSFDKSDGIKELLLETREAYCKELPEEQDRLTPGAMQTMLQYLRNLCLVRQLLTPSMYDLVVAGQGVGGGGYAGRLLEMAKFYPYQQNPKDREIIRIILDRGYTDILGEFDLKNRLPGPPFELKNLRLERRPTLEKKIQWKRHFGNGSSECSWPEEDDKIENFTRHVKLRALSVVRDDVARIEKFTSSIKDGLDLRETIRQWHTKEIYVKELPPVRGDVGAVIFIFDDNFAEYPWRITWYAEHQNESTLSFYATHHENNVIGPGISKAFYGGAMFLYPPQPIANIWTDSHFNYACNPIEKLVASATCYSENKFVAYVAKERPSLVCQSIARQYQKHIIYLPLSTFSMHTLRKLRQFHVLQGHIVRSFAHQYIH